MTPFGITSNEASASSSGLKTNGPIHVDNSSTSLFSPRLSLHTFPYVWFYRQIKGVQEVGYINETHFRNYSITLPNFTMDLFTSSVYGLTWH